MRIESSVGKMSARHVPLDEAELRLLQQVLNTAANGPFIENLESEVGASRATMRDWLNSVSTALESSRPARVALDLAHRSFDLQLNASEGLALSRLNQVVLSYLGEEEFFTLTGFDLSDGQELVSKFNVILNPRAVDRRAAV